jgi:hypothetical protein
MTDEGYLITVGEFGAMIALSPHLAWQFHSVKLIKAKLFKEVRFVGQAKNG